MDITEFLIIGLAVWRISSLIVLEDGPWDILAKFRSLSGVRYNEQSIAYSTTAFSGLLICIWCLSPWIAGAFTLAFLLSPYWTLLIALPFALSAMAVIIDQQISRWNNG